MEARSLRTQPPAIGEVAGDICELPRCGGRLARYNDSGRCAPCQAAERALLSAPPEVPASSWEHQPVRQALAERHLGQVIRAYRCHPYHGRHPLPQTVVAGWMGVTTQRSPAGWRTARRWCIWTGLPMAIRYPRSAYLWFTPIGRNHMTNVAATPEPPPPGPDEGRRSTALPPSPP